MTSFNDLLEHGHIPAVLLPYQEIRDCFQHNGNYFDKLNKRAETRARKAGIDGIHNRRPAMGPLRLNQRT